MFCATYKDIKRFCTELKITKPPEKILLHCGCNDIDTNKKDTLKIFGDIDETLKTLQKTFPTTKIIISTLVPRGEAEVKVVVKEINKYLLSIPSKAPQIQVMNNKQIDESMLRDNKHINKKGFFIFLANIRFSMCGMLPKVSSFRSLPYNDRGNRKRY